MGAYHSGILFVTRFPPDPTGYGGAQRAWHVLRALAARGPVDLLVIYHQGDDETEAVHLDAVELGVRSCAKFVVQGWEGPLRRWPRLPYKMGLFLELFSPYCTEAPRVSGRSLRRMAKVIPRRNYDLVVAGRLPSAYLVSKLKESRLLNFDIGVIEMDDVLSHYKETWIEAQSQEIGRFRTWLWRVDAMRIASAERQMLRAWDATSVCTADDVGRLEKACPGASVYVVPNVINRTRLTGQSASASVLFVGSLASHPNREGLVRFLNEAWPTIRAAVPNATLDVVGLYPFDGLRQRLNAESGRLHANVPDVEPYYRAATVVISPIFFGSGTRIKVLETMAFGRPLVTSSLGAAGLGIENERHALVADEMSDFASAVIRLLNNSNLRCSLADAAYELQQVRFGPLALSQALNEMIEGAEKGKGFYKDSLVQDRKAEYLSKP